MFSNYDVQSIDRVCTWAENGTNKICSTYFWTIIMTGFYMQIILSLRLKY